MVEDMAFIDGSAHDRIDMGVDAQSADRWLYCMAGVISPNWVLGVRYLASYGAHHASIADAGERCSRFARR